jgi:hypothetical protein
LNVCVFEACNKKKKYPCVTNMLSAHRLCISFSNKRTWNLTLKQCKRKKNRLAKPGRRQTEIDDRWLRAKVKLAWNEE